MGRNAWWVVLVLGAWVGCSGEESTRSEQTTDDAGIEAGVESGASVDGSDASDSSDATTTEFGLPLCTELGVENVLPYDTTIANAFALKVMNDCRVIQLLLPLTQAEGGVWLESTAGWTASFFGCPGSDESITSFGPVETGKSPVLSQVDIDVLVEYFAVATEESIELSSAQSAALRSELAKVAALAVNLPVAEHALSLCTDGGTPDGGAPDGGAPDGGAPDAAADGAADAGQPDSTVSDAEPADGGTLESGSD